MATDAADAAAAAAAEAVVIDGKAIATAIHAEIQQEVSYLWNNYGRVSPL
jgi:hypothetical protein